MFVINLNAIPVFKEHTNFLLKEKEIKSLLNLKYIFIISRFFYI